MIGLLIAEFSFPRIWWVIRCESPRKVTILLMTLPVSVPVINVAINFCAKMNTTKPTATASIPFTISLLSSKLIALCQERRPHSLLSNQFIVRLCPESPACSQSLSVDYGFVSTELRLLPTDLPYCWLKMRAGQCRLGFGRRLPGLRSLVPLSCRRMLPGGAGQSAIMQYPYANTYFSFPPTWII